MVSGRAWNARGGAVYGDGIITPAISVLRAAGFPSRNLCVLK
jgi:hypothetical protein